MEEYDSRQDTLDHISAVNFFLNVIIKELRQRALYHDLSKLNQPEKKFFDKFTLLLRDTTYDSDKYKSFLAEMRPALEHHYANNRHHPEHNEKSNVSIYNRKIIDRLRKITGKDAWIGKIFWIGETKEQFLDYFILRRKR